MFFHRKPHPQPNEFLSPVTGRVCPLSSTPDEAFAGGQLGDGVVSRYDGSYVLSPCDAEVSVVPKTLHSVCLTADNGAELLIYIGVDTVMLNGQGFKMLVKQGQHVTAGQKLIRIDRQFMAERGLDLATPMVLLNGDEMKLTILCSDGPVTAADTPVFRCEPIG